MTRRYTNDENDPSGYRFYRRNPEPPPFPVELGPCIERLASLLAHAPIQTGLDHVTEEGVRVRLYKNKKGQVSAYSANNKRSYILTGVVPADLSDSG